MAAKEEEAEKLKANLIRKTRNHFAEAVKKKNVES